LIVSTRSGTSLTRVEKANATAPGRTLLREQSQENESR